jgi:hypothetical protein
LHDEQGGDGGRAFAVATTFLCPGHDGTPEHALLARSGDGGGRGGAGGSACGGLDALVRAARRTCTLYLQRTGDFSAVRWFHEHGIPQVVPTPRPLYRPYPESRVVA